jgi:negative regulator of sigma E activity
MADKDMRYDKAELVETLSAYLDGELSPSLTEKVERQLADDPQVRQLLNELRRVSDSLAGLPRVAAPDDLAEEVIQQLERDLLLDQGDAVAEMAGRNHLRLRRFLAAAAVLILAGAIVTIVYNVLSQSPNGSAPVIQPEIVAIAPDETPISKTIPPLAADAGENDTDTLKAALFQINLSQLRMVVNTPDVPTLGVRLDQMFRDLQIDNVFREYVGLSSCSFSLVCPIDKFRQFFQNLEKAENRIDIAVTDEAAGREIMVQNATEEQALVLAGEANPLIQVAQALRFTAVEHRGDFDRQDSDDTPELLRLFAQVEPDLTGLQPLAPPIDAAPFSDVKDVYYEDIPRIAANEPPPTTLLGQADRPKPPTPTDTPTREDQTKTNPSQPARMIALVLVLQGLEPLEPPPTTNQAIPPIEAVDAPTKNPYLEDNDQIPTPSKPFDPNN